MLIYTRTYKEALKRILPVFGGIEFMVLSSRETRTITSHIKTTVADRIIYDTDAASIPVVNRDIKSVLLITHEKHKQEVERIMKEYRVRGMKWFRMPRSYSFKSNYAYKNGRGEIVFKIDMLKGRIYEPNTNLEPQS